MGRRRCGPRDGNGWCWGGPQTPEDRSWWPHPECAEGSDLLLCLSVFCPSCPQTLGDIASPCRSRAPQLPGCDEAERSGCGEASRLGAAESGEGERTRLKGLGADVSPRATPSTIWSISRDLPAVRLVPGVNVKPCAEPAEPAGWVMSSLQPPEQSFPPTLCYSLGTDFWRKTHK